MQLDNRVIYNTRTGTIIYQTGEATGDVVPHETDVQLAYLDIPYGSLDYSKSYVQRINKDGNPVIMTYDNPETKEQRRIRELEDALLLQTDLENGGIL